jgi:methyltransferase (TIGR00027 family)
MTRASASTAAGPTASVAIEQYLPKDRRIVDDAFAYSILSPSMRLIVSLTRAAFIRNWFIRQSEVSAPGIWGGVLCRKRYIDDALAQSLGSVDSVVNLGAGLDTRAFRLPGLAHMPIWEVDQPQNIDFKRTRLQRLLGATPRRLTLVPIDFDHEDLPQVLSQHGYKADGPTFFILEAVTQYLTPAGIDATFKFLASAQTGSRVAFTFIRKDFVEGRVMYGQERLHQQYVTRGIWLFGLDPDGVDAFLASYGWRTVEQLGYDGLADRYVKPTGRNLALTPLERLVLAAKT